MESRMEIEAQYDEDMRDGRTLRQKVHTIIMYTEIIHKLRNCGQ